LHRICVSAAVRYASKVLNHFCHNRDGDCTGTMIPPVAAVLLPAGSTLINPDDIVSVTGQGAICDAVLPGVGVR
jgi:hypothetical protein